LLFSFSLSLYWRLEVRTIRLAAISGLFTRLEQLLIADCLIVD
jgi:hypothetical protein